MLKQRYLKESEWNYALALRYYGQLYYDFLECCGRKPSFTFDDIEYFTVKNREDGLSEIAFYDKNDGYLFCELD